MKKKKPSAFKVIARIIVLIILFAALSGGIAALIKGDGGSGFDSSSSSSSAPAPDNPDKPDEKIVIRVSAGTVIF
mgnify:CR=1 FL=1